ncbi:MAG: alpha/beta hydrolase [Myxococcota bacterium]
MTTFALLHGTWGVPQQWADVVGYLMFHGDRGIAVDQPIGAPDASLMACAEQVARALEGTRGRVVLVSHSSSGYVATLVPALRPVDQIIFVSALVPRPGLPAVVRRPGSALAQGSGDLELSPPAFRALLEEQPDGTTTINIDGLLPFVTEDPDDPTARRLRELLRPTATRLFEEPWPLGEFPAVPMSYVVCGRDGVLPAASQRILAARAKAQIYELPDADHAVALKEAPRLAGLLTEIAAKTPRR